MSLRWVPPVYSPVSVGSLAHGVAVASGVSTSDESAVIAKLSSVFRASHVALVDSGTTALTLSLRAVAKPGDAIALPAYSCIDLITAAQGAQGKVRFYDVSPRTLSPDLDSLSATVARGVAAIVVAPLFGYPIDFEGVRQIAARAGIPVVEDAAQSAGAQLNGQRVGSFGAISILSFARGKGTTGGSGGAVLSRDSGLGERIREMTEGLTANSRGWREIVLLGAQWTLGRPLLYGIPSSIPFLRLGEMIYHAPHPPRAMPAASLSILRAALDADDQEIVVRQRRARDLQAMMPTARGFSAIEAVPGGVPGYLRFAVVDRTGRAVPSPKIGALRSYPITLDEHAESRRVLMEGETAGAGAREIRDRLFTLPTHSRISSGDINRMGAWLRSTEDA